MKKTAPAFNTWITVALASVVGFWFSIVFFDSSHAFLFDDFLVFAEAGELARAKKSVYLFVEGWPAGYKFKYSPFAAVFYGYGLPHEPETAAWIHFGLSLLAWLSIGVWAVRQIRLSARAAQTLWPLILTIAAFAIPLRDELKMGQCNGFVALAVLIAITQTRRAWLAGFALAFAILLKTYAVFALPWFLFRKDFRVLAFTVLGGLVLGLGIPALVYGSSHMMSEHLRWVQILTDSTAGLVTRFDNASLLSFAAKTSGDLFASRTLWSIAFAAFLLGAWQLRKRNPARAYAYWGAAVLPLTPLSWPYWNLMAFPAALFVVQTFSRWPRWITVLLLLISMNKVNGTWGELALPLVACVCLAIRLATAKLQPRADSPV